MGIIKIEYDTGIKGGLWNSFIEKLTIYPDHVDYNKIWYINLKDYEAFKEELMYDYKDVTWKIAGGTNNSTINSIRNFIEKANELKVAQKENSDSVSISYSDDSNKTKIVFTLSKYIELKEELRLLVYNSLVDEIKVPDFIKNDEDRKAESYNKQIKSRERVEKHGEVFTNEREVKAMCDLVKQETTRIDSRFLEPACGDGNFLVEILSRKLEVVKKKYKKSPFDFEKQSLLAVSSVYGVDIMQDNVIECRNRLYVLWEKYYKAICKADCNEDTKNSIKFILKRNIVCGNALSLKCVDEFQNDTDEPIVFSEWAFITGNNIQRKDYSFAEMLEQKIDTTNGEGKFLKQYISNYRRIGEYE